jgi:hypothetical protein
MAVNHNQSRESVEPQQGLSRAASGEDDLLIADHQGWLAKKMTAIGTAGGEFSRQLPRAIYGQSHRLPRF